MCEHRDTTQCKVNGNSNTTHTKCCYINVLLYLTYPLLTARQIANSAIHNRNTYRKGCPTGLPFLLALWTRYCSASHPCLLSAGLIGKKTLWANVPMRKVRKTEISLAIARYRFGSFSVPACNIFTILTELSWLPSAART